MIHRFNIANDGKLEEMATQQPNKYDEMARRVISQVTSGGTATNRIQPFDRFAQGPAVMGADSFTRNCMAASKPVKAPGFDTSKSGNWLAK